MSYICRCLFKHLTRAGHSAGSFGKGGNQVWCTIKMMVMNELQTIFAGFEA
jgi:hypothetical protein